MAGFLSRRDAKKGYNAAGGENFNSDYRSEKQKLRASGLRGRELRQTARKNVMGDAISKSVDLEDTMNKNLDQMNYEINALNDNDMHRLIMQGQQEQRDLSDQLAEESEALQGLVKPIQIKQVRVPTSGATSVAVPAKVGAPQATDATVETPAPGQVVQIQNAPVVKQEEPDYNSMSYNDAFRAARKLKGKDGTFEWKGKSYGTKYADEVAAENAAATKAKATTTNPKISTSSTAKSSLPTVATTQAAAPVATAQNASKVQTQVTAPTTQVDSANGSQASNLTRPATIISRPDSTIQNSDVSPGVTVVQTSQSKDISKPWNRTYQLGNRTLPHDQMEDYLFDGKLDDPNLYRGTPIMSPVPEEYAKNTDTSRFTFGKPISTSELYTDRASNVTPRQQYTQQNLNDELRQIDSQTWYNQNARRQAVNNAYAKYNASR